MEFYSSDLSENIFLSGIDDDIDNISDEVIDDDELLLFVYGREFFMDVVLNLVFVKSNGLIVLNLGEKRKFFIVEIK